MALRIILLAAAVASDPPPGPPHHHVDPFHAMPATRCHGWGRSHPGELCPTDPICAASVTRFATAKRHAPPRVAVLLRGVAFRNWGDRRTEGSCCRGSETAQRSVVASWDEHLFAPLEQRGYEVNIYVATYRCSNGKDWVERDLLSQLAPRLRGVYLGSYDNTTQSSTHGRAFELAHAESSSREDTAAEFLGPRPRDRAFEHVFVMRLDMAITAANLTCLFDANGPMTKTGNADGFAYLPGRYFACAVRTRFAGGYGHDYVAKLLSVAGDDAPPRKPALYYPHLAGDDQGSVCGWRWRKRSAETTGGPRGECYVPRRAEREYVPGV